LFYPTPEERALVGDLKNAGEILEAVVDDRNEELSRASAGLALSGQVAPSSKKTSLAGYTEEDEQGGS
jgi:hypothetical protein